MGQTLVIVLVILAVLAYVIRYYVRIYRSDVPTCSGCPGCHVNASVEDRDRAVTELFAGPEKTCPEADPCDCPLPLKHEK